MIYPRLLALAERLHYPRLVLGLQTIDASREGWYDFVSHATEMTMEEALLRLQRHVKSKQAKEEVNV